MTLRTTVAWLAILTLALLLFSSCKRGGYYRHANYRIGGRVSYGGYYGGHPWGYYPGYPIYPGRPSEIDLPYIDEPIAVPLLAMGPGSFRRFPRFLTRAIPPESGDLNQAQYTPAGRDPPLTPYATVRSAG